MGGVGGGFFPDDPRAAGLGLNTTGFLHNATDLRARLTERCEQVSVRDFLKRAIIADEGEISTRGTMNMIVLKNEV